MARFSETGIEPVPAQCIGMLTLDLADFLKRNASGLQTRQRIPNMVKLPMYPRSAASCRKGLRKRGVRQAMGHHAGLVRIEARQGDF